MDLKSFLNTVNRDSLVGLSVPVIRHRGTIASVIGYYCPEMRTGHITLPESELRSAAGLALHGQRFPRGRSRAEENAGSLSTPRSGA